MKKCSKTISLLTTLILVVAIQVGFSQDKRNSVGPTLLGLPSAIAGADALIVNAEYERFLNSKNSLAFRIEFLKYSYEEIKTTSRETGSGNGGGVGISYKHYFSPSGYEGFFLGPALELVFMSGDYFYRRTQGSVYSESGTSNNIAICPNLMTGYRINIGDVFSITPTLMLGYRVGISIQKTGTFEGESGPLAAIGANFGFRF